MQNIAYIQQNKRQSDVKNRKCSIVVGVGLCFCTVTKKMQILFTNVSCCLWLQALQKENKA